MVNDARSPSLPRPRLARHALAVAVAAMALGGCTGVPRKSTQSLAPVDEHTLDRMAEHTVAESAKLAEVQQRLFEELQRVQQAQPAPPVVPQYDPLEDQLVSIRMYEADVGQLLWAMSEQLGMNLMLDPRVVQTGRRSSINLSNVTAREVFDHILRAFDLHGEVQGKTLIVNLMEEKVYDLDFLNTALSVDISSGGNVFGANQSTGGGGGGGSSGGGSNALRSDFALSGGLGEQTSVHAELEEALASLIGEGGGGRRAQDGAEDADPVPAGMYNLNSVTGTLFVRARPSQVRAVESLISRYKAVLGRQVQIEAQLIDVELKDGFQWGVDWNVLRNHVAGVIGRAPIAVDPATALLPPGPGAELPVRTLTLPAQTIGSAAGNALGLGYQRNSFSVAIDALRNFGNVKVLSNPSIRARNGSPALLSVGTNIRYLSSSSVTVTNPGGGATTTSSDAQTDSLFSGIVVGVVPFIRADRQVEILIHPMQTDVDPNSLQLVDAGGGTRVTLPVINFKGMTTTLGLRDGDTVLIGGLIDQKLGRSNSGVPGLSDVPGVGKFFDRTADSHASRELVMVLKVRVL
ncbi:pilus (MSHA type) biogenesis protein MshL [Pseudomarimonas salicorniae]|uniref:Pilus (MSHA type) biogenesis protein MshL n=1 Tax=Pseudomarimonas salicorniae TaxID=2933270 RepID=A0ABT0GH82_9GAMM|nr:pilus (MSHA type) biogenesis protein MshL [Lysobacter sp. CAU 1642]MCK7593788.1 pilus (MSHA type) biogenesis protein MshL [Lysobacter sp. CAU 1642]